MQLLILYEGNTHNTCLRFLYVLRSRERHPWAGSRFGCRGGGYIASGPDRATRSNPGELVPPSVLRQYNKKTQSEPVQKNLAEPQAGDLLDTHPVQHGKKQEQPGNVRSQPPPTAKIALSF